MGRGWRIFLAVTMAVFIVGGVASAAAKTAGKVNGENPGQKVPAERFTAVKQGARGEQVKTVQRLLKELGYQTGEIDGVCGPQTVDAIMRFQLANGLLADGVVGETTLARMRRAEPVTSRNMRAMIMRASAYSAHDPGNSSYTATGSYLRKGLVAVDPSVIPLGTRLYIPGYGMAVADDVGGAIVGDRIDLAFDSHGEALQFGRREITVYIVD